MRDHPSGLSFSYDSSFFQAVDNEGLQFGNLTSKGDFPPINYMVMLIVDIFLYFLLALYLDVVIPAEYGQRKPPYFIFMPSFWKSLFGNKKVNTPNRQMSAREQETSEDIEAVHADMHGNEAIRYNFVTIHVCLSMEFFKANLHFLGFKMVRGFPSCNKYILQLIMLSMKKIIPGKLFYHKQAG